MAGQKWVINAGADPGGARGPKIGKNMIFLGNILIFHTKYPKYFRASLHSIFFSAPPPPPLTWNPGSAPVKWIEKDTLFQLRAHNTTAPYI